MAKDKGGSTEQSEDAQKIQKIVEGVGIPWSSKDDRGSNDESEKR